MLNRDQKRRALLTVMSGFMERHATEVEKGMTDEMLAELMPPG